MKIQQYYIWTWLREDLINEKVVKNEGHQNKASESVVVLGEPPLNGADKKEKMK